MRNIKFTKFGTLHRENFIVKVLYQRMPDYQPFRRNEHCNVYMNQQDAQNCCYSHTTARRVVPAYTGIYQMRCTAHKVAPDDGLIQSETSRASNGK